MDEKRMTQFLHDIATEAVPADKDPWTALQTKVEAEHSGIDSGVRQSRRGRVQGTGRLNLAKVLAVIAIAFMLMVVAMVSPPQGRAWAQQIVELFSRAEALFFPLSAEQIEGANQAQFDQQRGVTPPTAAPPETLLFFDESCESDDPDLNYRCQLEQAEGEVGFVILLPPFEDSGLAIASLSVDTLTNTVRAGYTYEDYPERGQGVWIQQGLGEFPVGSDWEKVPFEFIESVMVNGEQAEFVRGTFVAKPGAEQATWLADGPMARLRWKHGERWFEISKAGAPEGVNFMDREGMILLAESLMELEETR